MSKDDTIVARRLPDGTLVQALDRLLDRDNGKATIESLQWAAKIVRRELRMELV